MRDYEIKYIRSKAEVADVTSKVQDFRYNIDTPFALIRDILGVGNQRQLDALDMSVMAKAMMEINEFWRYRSANKQ